MAALSMVSKSYRSLMASPQLQKTRSLMGFTENSLYVCLLTLPDPIPRWFILRRGGSSSTVNRLLRIPIPSSPSQPTKGSAVVALDWGIYVIGGWSKGKPRSSNVLLLDCRTHTWSKAPSMRVPRASAVAGFVDGKIYVCGGCVDKDGSNWGEVFDPKTQTWDFLPPMLDQFMRNQYLHMSVVVKEDKLYALDTVGNTLYYSPRQGQWGNVKTIRQRIKKDWCCIDGFIYSCGCSGYLYWCEQDQLDRDIENMFWRKVQGLEALTQMLSTSRLGFCFSSKHQALWEECSTLYDTDDPDIFLGARLFNSGGNIVLFWE